MYVSHNFVVVWFNDRQLSGQENRTVRSGVLREGVFRHRASSGDTLGPPGSGYILADLAGFAGNRLESLKGDRKGQFSIRINDQWRICFEWPIFSPGPMNVEIIDYH